MGTRKGHYAPRIAETICREIALGKTLEQALAAVGYLAPSLPQVWRWLDEHEEFRAKYERARQLQADTLADETLGMLGDILKAPKAAPAYRLAIDLLRWHAAIRKPKVYNDKQNSEGVSQQLDAAKIKSEIKRLEKELGVVEGAKGDGPAKLKVVPANFRKKAPE